MAKCKYCGKNTGLNPFCTQHKKQWYSEEYPYRRCLYCDDQLYPNGISKSQFFKQLFCDGNCRNEFVSLGVILTKPFTNVSPLERTLTTVQSVGEKVQLIEDLITHKFYTLTLQGKKITKSAYVNSPHEAIFNAMRVAGWI